jgi:peptidoglycan/xylan/chitin deacetylase (PgdA/CDA1 family)
VLRLSVEVFSRDGETRARFGELLAEAGFARAATRNWETTLAIDLRPDETDLFASFTPLARRAIRSATKVPVQIRVIEDLRLGDRLEALSRETLQRTGGRYQALWNWAGVIELSRRVPDAARLVGLFRTDREGPDALLGFAWGWWNGQSASYFAGGSSRPTDLRGVSIGHPLMWDLVLWAKRGGATWFDLGGVTSGTLGSGDPLGGISDFKRLFSKETVAVAEDWVLEPHALPARVAAAVSGCAAWLSRAAARSPRPRDPAGVSQPLAVEAGGPVSAAVTPSRTMVFRLVSADALAPVLRSLGRGLVSIFTLHRFTDPEHDVPGHDPAALRDHLAYLRRHRYRLVSLTDVLKFLDEGDPNPGVPAVAFTVDDGYADFARIGAPIFAEFDCPVTLFVPTGFVDGRLWFWWDRVTYLIQQTRRSSLHLQVGSEQHIYRWSSATERARVQQEVLDRLEWVDDPAREPVIAALARQLEVGLPTLPPPAFAPIGWDEVRRTAKRGVTFGPHTVTHRILPFAGEDACAWEINESYRRLRDETDAHIPLFCYPAGRAKRRELEVTRQSGLRAAVTTVPGYAVPHGVREWGPLRRFALPRFPYPDDLAHLVNIVTGMARLRRKVRHPRADASGPGVSPGEPDPAADAPAPRPRQGIALRDFTAYTMNSGSD